jgi:hypothetical protein
LSDCRNKDELVQKRRRENNCGKDRGREKREKRKKRMKKKRREEKKGRKQKRKKEKNYF